MLYFFVGTRCVAVKDMYDFAVISRTRIVRSSFILQPPPGAFHESGVVGQVLFIISGTLVLWLDGRVFEHDV